jgi:hypothetical protein
MKGWGRNWPSLFWEPRIFAGQLKLNGYAFYAKRVYEWAGGFKL